MCIARRHRHGLQESPTCALCGVGTEEIDHLLLACPYSVEVWSLALRLPGLDDLLLLDMASFWVSWTTSRKRVAKTARREDSTPWYCSLAGNCRRKETPGRSTQRRGIQLCSSAPSSTKPTFGSQRASVTLLACCHCSWQRRKTIL